MAVMISTFATLILGVLSVSQRPLYQPQRLLLACFFIALTLYGIDTVLYWNDAVHAIAADTVPWLFFSLGFALFLQGPLLYGYSKFCFQRRVQWRRRYLWHLLPCALFPFYLYFIYFNKSSDARLLQVNDWQLVLDDVGFYALIWAQRLSVWVYSVLCVVQLRRYQRYLQESGVVVAKLELRWYRWLFYGFCVVNGWVLLALLISAFTDLGWDSPMGVMDSYCRFIYVATLLVLLLQRSVLAALPSECQMQEGGAAEAQWRQQLAHLQSWMTTERPYLDPLLTQEKLAQQVGFSPKLLSQLLNQGLEQNFFEFVCRYRVEAAKAILSDPMHKSLPVSEVMIACGFNSKSAFNSAFKKSTAMTPSHFRRQQQY